MLRAGGDDATRQGWSPAHRQQFFDPYKEDPESVDEPSTQEPACVVRDPLNGKTALREACASLLKGEPYGDLDPSQRCALLRTLIDAALNTKTVTEEINKRATKIVRTRREFLKFSELQLWEDGVSTRSRRRDAVFTITRRVRCEPSATASVPRRRTPSRASGPRARRRCRTTTCAVGGAPRTRGGI